MRKKAILYKPIIFTLVLALAAICGYCYIYHKEALEIIAPIIAVALILSMGLLFRASKDVDKMVKTFGTAIGNMQEDVLKNFPLPVIIATNHEVIWCNDTAIKAFGESENWTAQPDVDVLNEEIVKNGEGEIDLSDRKYHAYSVNAETDSGIMTTYYLYDITEMERDATLYKETRLSVWMIAIDSIDEAMQDARENERSQFLSQIEYQIEKFFGDREGIIIKSHRERFVGILEESYMRDAVAKRFELLDNVRALNKTDGFPLTLSIGVARMVNTMTEGEQAAGQALDMALGRGGDQAAVKTQGGYEFYGGLSKGIEKRTKVKTRIIATALTELIDSSFNVVIMGHKFADLDSIGSAVGLMKAVRQKGKSCIVAVNRSRNLVWSLIESLEGNGYENSFLNPVDVMERIRANTLLIIVDTHLPHVLESEEIYKACKNVVVIDHHRRMVGHIDNAVIFYHEPYASSASEMVTELIQYFGLKTPIGRIEAEALLAGIMLDTKNFVIRTGVRTFEAAAYLRRQGADTVEVKKHFSSTMESYQRRARVVSSAEVYRRCAISSTNFMTEDIKLVAPQAADELLNISDVDASFVLYEYDGGVTISARSMGKLNVQVIMEALGGGGHQTMAAVQLGTISMETARQHLLEAIDEFLNNNAVH